MKVGIIGLGFVGLSLAVFLSSKNVKVTGIDTDTTKIQTIQKGIPPFYEPTLQHYLKKAIKTGLKLKTKISSDVFSNDLIFLTVGTPINKHGEINLDYIKSAVISLNKKLQFAKKIPTIIVKSTVVPGTTIQIIKPLLERNSFQESIDFNLLTNPEFLRESSAIKDTRNPHVVIVGGNDTKSRKKLVKFYKKIYPKNQDYVETNTTTAEMIKYANNAFLATKITFINSMANMCQKIPDTNVDDIAKVMGMDPRISHLFLNAGPGFGGSCFPKDLQALIAYSKNIGYSPKLLEAVQNCNNQQVDSIIKLLKKNVKNLHILQNVLQILAMFLIHTHNLQIISLNQPHLIIERAYNLYRKKHLMDNSLDLLIFFVYPQMH